MGLKKPKKPKMGKQPKANAKAEVWERYHAREKDKFNDYQKRVKQFEADKKKVVEIKKSVEKLKQNRN